MALSAGIQVPQLTQRTNFLSPLSEELLTSSLEPGGDLTMVFATPNIFFTNWT
jgi:hypothetical protein